MGKKVLLLSVILLVSGWVMAQPEAEAISCINVSDVTLLPAAGCDLGGLTFSNFTVSASAGFIAGTKVGLGPLSTVSEPHQRQPAVPADHGQQPDTALSPWSGRRAAELRGESLLGTAPYRYQPHQ